MDDSRSDAPFSDLNSYSIKEEITSMGERRLPTAKDTSEDEVLLIAKGKLTKPLIPAPYEMPIMAKAVPSSNSYRETKRMKRSNLSHEPNKKENYTSREQAITATESGPNLASTSFALRPSHASLHKPEHEIQVTIGKVEVKAVLPTSQSMKQSFEPAVTSLEEYLNRRARRCGR